MGYIPLQVMQVEVKGVDRQLSLARNEGREEVRKRKEDIGPGGVPVHGCIKHTFQAHVVVHPHACSHIHPAFSCLYVAA